MTDTPAGSDARSGERPDFRRLAIPTIVLLAFLASASSLANGYAYDDTWIISTNTRIHSLAHWWQFFGQTYWPPSYNAALYRPLTILAFSIEWVIGGGSPFPLHLVNVALYAAVCALFFRLARTFVPPLGAWVAAALFAVHPVHVEAVGNGVGQSELWVALCFFWAIERYVTWRREGALGPRRIAALAAVYLAACMFKEQGITLPALLVAAELTVVTNGGRLLERARTLRFFYYALVVVAALYLAMRIRVLGGWAGDNPHPVWVELSRGERLLTVVGVLVPEWARLLVWPQRLLADYSPLDIPLVRQPGLVLLPGIVILVGLAALLGAAWRRLPVAAFGLLVMILAIAPVSNVLFASGVMVAERTLFLPSAGMLLALGAAVPLVLPRLRESRPITLAAAGTLALLLTAGTMHSAARQPAWKSSPDIFIETLGDAPLNFRAHYTWGAQLFAMGKNASGEKEWRIAMKLYPFYHGVKFDLAEASRKNRMYAPAVPLYQSVLETAPDRADARSQLVWCLLKLGRYDEARVQAAKGIAWGNSTEAFRLLLARALKGTRLRGGANSDSTRAQLAQHVAGDAPYFTDAAPPSARPAPSARAGHEGTLMGPKLRTEALAEPSGRMQRAVQNTRSIGSEP